MPGRIPAPLVRLGLSAFRRLPHRARLWAVRAGTPNYTVGALVLLRRGEEMLLVRQRHTGAWALPGGLLSRGETADEAVRRELAEEIGITADGDRLGSAVGVFVDPASRRVDVLYALDVEPGTPAPDGRSPEVVGAGWFTSASLPPLTPATPAIVEHYDRIGALRGAGG